MFRLLLDALIATWRFITDTEQPPPRPTNEPEDPEDMSAFWLSSPDRF